MIVLNVTDALISQYNKILTKNEEQRQYLLNVVQQHREKFKLVKKSLLIQMNTDQGFTVHRLQD